MKFILIKLQGINLQTETAGLYNQFLFDMCNFTYKIYKVIAFLTDILCHGELFAKIPVKGF